MRRASVKIWWPMALVLPVLMLFSDLVWASSVIRQFTPRYSTTQRGEVLVIGNSSMTCPDSQTNCPAARNRVGTILNNNSYTMEYVNPDNVSTIPANSSTADLVLPAGGEVLFAGLYWGAATSAGARGVAAPQPVRRNIVQFATPGSSYVSITASRVDNNASDFSAFADVTSQVRAAGAGTYKVSGIQAGTGADRYAGWSLVVVVSDPNLPPRNMTVFDGYAIINTSTPREITTRVSGFLTPPTGPVNTMLGVVAYEGDQLYVNDIFQLNGNTLSDAVNPADNFFNSTISELGQDVMDRNPSYLNVLGIDIDRMQTNALGNNETDADLTFSSSGDVYYPVVFTFQVDVFEPVIRPVKSYTDVNGGQVEAGDIIEYTIEVPNTGNDGAVNVVLTDPIPENTSYVPNSLIVTEGANAGAKSDLASDDQAEFVTGPDRVVFRLGEGANGTDGGRLAPEASTTIRFRVMIDPDAPGGTNIDNQGSVDYTSETLEEPKEADTNLIRLTVHPVSADIAITKTNTPGQNNNVDLSDDTLVSDSETTYQITVTNNGPGNVRGVLVTDPADRRRGLNCPDGNEVTCRGSESGVCPSATTTVGTLSSPGYRLGSLPNGSSASLTFTCTVE